MRGGLFGTEVEYFWVDKAGGLHFGVAGNAKVLGASVAGANFLLIDVGDGCGRGD